MERKQLEDLIQRLWDQGASIGIMNILKHDKEQREAFAQVEAELRHERIICMRKATELKLAQMQLAEAVNLLKRFDTSAPKYDYLYERVDAFLARHAQAEQQES